MRLHHIDCGRHRPLGGAPLDGRSQGPFADLCTHCLLIEIDSSLVLVDTGYGLADVRRQGRLARLWPLILNVQFSEAATARRQVEALGFTARDVRHVVLTHLDFNHAGGLADFPEARVHVLAAERAAPGSATGLVGRQRYRPQLWSGVRDWRSYAATGERWLAFEAVRALDGLPPEILMLPLPGHTLGHAGVAVAMPDGWLVDAGDAYLHKGQVANPHPHIPPGLRPCERIMAADPPAARTNLRRLRDVAGAPSVQVFCSHDSAELAALQCQAGQQGSNL